MPTQERIVTPASTPDTQPPAEAQRAEESDGAGPAQSETQADSPAETVPETSEMSAGGNAVTDQLPLGPSAPPPSVLEDPAGALSRIFDTGHRADLPHDLSPWGMFMAADWVVKAVMIGLALASLTTWTVWLAKSLELAGAKARAKRALKAINASASLNEADQRLTGRRGPAAFMVQSAEGELRRSDAALDHAGNEGVKERVASRLQRIEAQAGRRLAKGTGLLATIGSTAPFVGLFGTVWGIMNAFIGISEAQTTNLAVVAPGIAEALLATAIGLVAAIPAVVIYNVFARGIAGYRQLLADAAAGVERLVSLDLDFRKVPAGAGPARAALAAE
ncbi:tonB-system energizer ExbB [Chelativorans sp. AA-79]|uniref:tonB-system energizer ExbB n=1 Tax=Chelativorans sp. AA-79 TaxID=3028735 RepID=UPI0023F765DD|nr:tonB-system energizer ExbB [Chelativorans sp. AA-79]WEX08524.1 tonB-system energizer ExbB [Chelativorans sp. AA-79]